MSGMEREMQARLQEDGGAGLQHPDPASGVGPGQGPVPGNEGVAPPAAGPSTTDTGAQGGQTVPDTIPYARFKEVNDKYSSLRGYETLASYGYDPDSLGRLAAFEAEYQSNPYGVLKTMAERLDLPQELLDRIVDPTIGAGDGSQGPGQAQSQGSSTRTDDLPPDVKERLEYVDQLRQRDAEEANNAQLGRVEAAWDRLDEADGISTPRMVKLMAIQSLAGGPQTFTTVDDFAKAARIPLMEYRDEALGSAVRNRQTGQTPSLPGSGPVPTEPVNFGTDIRAASKAAQAAIERGELPG